MGIIICYKAADNFTKFYDDIIFWLFQSIIS